MTDHPLRESVPLTQRSASPRDDLLEQQVAGEQLHRCQVTDIAGSDREVSEGGCPVAVGWLAEVSESVMGAPVIRAYGVRGAARKRVFGAIQDQYRANMRAALFFSLWPV